MPDLSKVAQMYHEVQTIFAIIFGMFLQFFFGENRTLRIGILIFTSSVFVAMYIVPLFIVFLNSVLSMGIKPDDKVAIAMYALSSLLSMEILAMTIKIMPDAIKTKFTKFLGVTGDTLKK